MKTLQTFEEYSWKNKDYSLYIDEILNGVTKKYTDLYKTEQSIYFYIVGECPISIYFNLNNIQIIVEVDGITDSLGTYDINDIDEVIEIINNFNVEEYRKNQ